MLCWVLNCHVAFLVCTVPVWKKDSFFRRRKSVSGGGWSLATRPKLELFYSIQFGTRLYLLTMMTVRDDGRPD